MAAMVARELPGGAGVAVETGLERFRRMFTRFDKLDLVFTFFIFFALIVDALKFI